MTKRATSLLFTLLFLLFGTSTVWGATIVPDQLVGGTSFQANSYPATVDNIKYYGEDNIRLNTANNKVARTTIPSAGKCEFKADINDRMFTHTIKGLPTDQSRNYSIIITGNNIKKLCIKWKDANNHNQERQFTSSPIHLDRAIPSKNGQVEYEVYAYGEQNCDFTISEIRVVGAIEQKIHSENGQNICKGESNTFTAIGMNAPIRWIYTDKSGNSTTLSETGTTVTFTNLQEGGILQANSCDPYEFKAVLCCNTQADKEIVHLQPFNMPNTSYSQCSVENLLDENYDPYDIATSYGYGYFKRTHKCPGEDRDEIKRNTSNFTRDVEQLPTGYGPVEEHYVIAKTTENMFAGWWHEQGNASMNKKPIKGHTHIDPVNPGDPDIDGFMVINCGRLAYDKDNLDKGKIFEYDIPGSLCTETWYDFSAWVCNLDQSTQHTFNPNVRFIVYGMNGTTVGEELLNFPTETIEDRATWVQKGGSFYSGNYNQFRVVLYNNQVPSDADACDIPGNDIGVDDISFTRCIPKLGVYTNEDRQGNAITMCNDGSELLNLYAGHPNYGITDMIEEPFYALMQSVEGGNWELVQKDDTPNNTYGYAKYELDVTGQGNTEYAVFVASKATLLDNIIRHFEGKPKSQYSALKESFNPGNLGCEIYAIGTSFTTVTMHCAEPRSKQPQAEDIALCGSDDLFDLNSLVTQVEIIDPSTANVTQTIKRADYSSQADFIAAVTAKGELKWYDSQTATTTISPNVSIATKDYWVSFDQKDASPITISESGKFKVTVTLKETYKPILNTNNLTKCLGDVTTDESRTIKVDSYTPANIPPTYKWYNVANDGTETEITGATSASYVIPLPTVGVSGKVKVYLESTDACTGSAEAVYSIADNPDFTYNISVPCAIELPSTGVNITLTNISGSNFVTIYRDGTQIKQETLSTGSTEYTYTDMGVSQTAEQVTYKIVLGAGDCSKTTDDLEYDITDTYQYQMTADATDIDETADGVEYHICAGDNVTITINDDFMGSDEQFEWYTVDVNGVESPLGVTGNTYTANGLQETTTFKTVIVPATPGATTCGGTANITINVDKKPVFKLAITRPTICHGDTNTVHIDYSDADVVIPANATFNWEAWYNADINNPSAKGDSYQGEYVATAQNAFKQHTFTNAGKYTFVLTVKNGTCTTTSDDNTTLFWAAGDPNFEVTATKEKTCGEEVTLSIKLNTDKPDDYTAYWTLSNSSEELTGKEISEDLKTISNTVSPNTTTTYTAHVDGTCKATDDITITVDNAATLDIEEVFPVCKNEQVKLELHIDGNYDKVVWTPAKGLSNAYDPQPIVTASDINTQQQEYDVIVYSGECEVPGHTTVKINDLPVITELVTTEVARQIKVDVNGMTPTFTIDQMETVYDVPATVSNLPIGWRRIYVKDINDCKTDSTIYIAPIEIKPMPSFSPNGEGASEREKWTVQDLDQYNSYIVEIFDRYGRKLWEYRTGSFSKDNINGHEPFGWDGMYNGHQMPSDDYWYLITVEEIRKQYTGHFILKR